MTREPPRYPTYVFDGWTYSRSRYELTNAQAVKIALTSGEHDMLLVFLQFPQVGLSRDFLFEKTVRTHVGLCRTDELRRIDVGITRLRRKLEVNAHHPEIIKTIRFVGYYFTPRPRVQIEEPAAPTAITAPTCSAGSRPPPGPL